MYPRVAMHWTKFTGLCRSGVCSLETGYLLIDNSCDAGSQNISYYMYILNLFVGTLAIFHTYVYMNMHLIGALIMYHSTFISSKKYRVGKATTSPPSKVDSAVWHTF